MKRNRRLYTQHGMSKHPIYRLWLQMIYRCDGRIESSYTQRNIKVCKRWQNNFTLFFNHVTSLPQYDINKIGKGKDELTLDRTDNDKDYEPGNVRWATPKQQWLNSINGKQYIALRFKQSDSDFENYYL